MKIDGWSSVDGLWSLVAGIAPLLLDLQYLPAHLAGLNKKSAHTHRQLEPPWACAAGIEIEDAIFHLLLGHMAVSRDYGSKSGRFGPQIQLIQVMQHVNI